ncbi:MAG: DUF72 domain-containing protein [Acidimicrobiia bacterium]
MGRIRIGLSGWSYDEWRGDFYPEGLAKSKELGFAAGRFDTLEINGTFYGLTTPRASRSWYEAAPSDFQYAVKASRYITHNKKLVDCDSAVANFFASGILELDDKLGPILWQLPPTLHFHPANVDEFLQLLPKDTDGAAGRARHHDDRVKSTSFGPGTNHRLRHVLELRHESFFVPEMVTLAHRHGVALAFSHASDFPFTEQVTAGFVYIRLHGPGQAYASPYDDAQIRRWADRARTWHKGEEPSDAVRISDRRPPARKGRDVYVYFDNDVGGHAPRQARRLRELIE